jgi:ribosome-binding ATPase YchF (GTP1/OBG family)
LIKHLESEKPARSFDALESDDDLKFFNELQLLTAKPVIYVCNVDEASVNTGNEFTKGFIEAHGGTIKVENTAGSGALFTIEIPTQANWGDDFSGGFLQ